MFNSSQFCYYLYNQWRKPLIITYSQTSVQRDFGCKVKSRVVSSFMLYGGFAYIIIKSMLYIHRRKNILQKQLLDVTLCYVHKCETYNKNINWKQSKLFSQLYNMFCYGKSYETWEQLYKNWLTVYRHNMSLFWSEQYWR